MRRTQYPLRFLTLSPQPPNSSRIITKIYFGLFAEFCHAVVYEAVVEVFATEMGVAVGGFDFKDTFFNSQ
jgi:hypothetical protein